MVWHENFEAAYKKAVTKMSIKTTQRITRQAALSLLTEELPNLPNDLLGDILDKIADSEQSHTFSKFDNFIVSDFPGESS
jgi:hypothetical protein